MLVGLFARSVWKMNFMDLRSLFTGSMTNPLGLSFATKIARADASFVACVNAYPLATLLRILWTQVLAVVLSR